MSSNAGILGLVFHYVISFTAAKIGFIFRMGNF